MKIPQKLFVDGGYRDGKSAKQISLINPTTEKPFVEIASAEPSDAIASVESAHRAFTGVWRDLAPGKRAEILFAIAAGLRARSEEIAQLECLEIGKPITDARDEAALGARIFEYYAGALSIFGGQTIPVGRGGLDFTVREPLGVIAAIVPWNFPFPIACWKVAPALAAGNTVVLKPASLSPLTALLLGEIAAEAGLPPGVLQVLPGAGAAVGEALVKHALVRKISFTGSTAVGSQLMAAAAQGIKRVSLELGGKSPNIVFADSDWEKAADKSPMSVFANTGQDCCARSRMFVERSVYDGFADRFISASRALVIGDPSEASTQLGPLVSAQQRKTVEGFLEGAKQRSTRLALGGDRPRATGYFLNPTVLLDVPFTDPCWQEEIFGPVVCIVPFDDEDAMIREVNASPYGLSGSVWTRSLDRALRVSRRIESGVISINSHSSVHVEAPFGGFKQSGIGRDLGMAALEGYTELKNIYIGG